MGPKLKLCTAVGAALLIVGLAALPWLIPEPDIYQNQIEQGLSEALGMEVTFKAPISYSWFPGLQIVLEAVDIRNAGLDVVSARRAVLRVRLLPLLRGIISIESIALDEADILIESGRNGRFNFQSNLQDGPNDTVLDLAILSLSNAEVSFTGELPWQAFHAATCDVEVRGLHYSNPGQGNSPGRLAFKGEFSCGEIETDDLVLSDVKVSMNADAGIITFEPIGLHLIDSSGTGRAIADFSGVVPQFFLRFSLPQFPIEMFFHTLSEEQIATGSMDFATDLLTKGETVDEMIQTMAGSVSLRGSDLILESADLDEELARLESSRSFNLVDIGAFFVAGPLGLAVIRGYEFASLLQGSGGTSEIRTLVSDWQIERGIMRATDVAMATGHNRIALQGSLDFVDRRFDDVIIAWIDSNGCMKARQAVEGPFEQPVIEAPSIIESLAQPALQLLKQGRDLLGNDPCEVFYAGSVPAPA